MQTFIVLLHLDFLFNYHFFILFSLTNKSYFVLLFILRGSSCLHYLLNICLIFLLLLRYRLLNIKKIKKVSNVKNKTSNC